MAARIRAFSFLGNLPSVGEGVGWVYFAMHGVPLVGAGTVSDAPVSQSVTASQLRDAWLLLVPVALLVVGGFLLARAGSDTAGGSARAALDGATLVLGYLPVAVVTLLVSRWERAGEAVGQAYDVVVGPDLMVGVGVAGLGYPLVWGAAGGLLASALERRRSRHEESCGSHGQE